MVSSSSTSTPSSRSNSKVIIFDWDDTICPSTFVDQCQIQRFTDFPLHFQNLMNEIGRVAEQCLAAAAQYGEVIIITNSDDGWVRFSAERYVPSLLPILPKYRVVSARTAYEQFYPGQPLCWKAAAFAHEVNEFYSQIEKEMQIEMSHNKNMDMDDIEQPLSPMISTDDSSDDSEMIMHRRDSSKKSLSSHRLPRSSKRKHSNTHSVSAATQAYITSQIKREVISFGDSMEERTAVKIVSTQLTALPKSVMFLTSPSPEQLIGQLVMLTGHMKYICDYTSDLDLEISPHQAEKMAESVLNERSRSPSYGHMPTASKSQVDAGGNPNIHDGRTMPRMRAAAGSNHDDAFSL
uniref:Uncharacterized protein n=1 Tax=Chaetoceros debilis TaxID=122233 RepID=A0A7S3Q317_9STRA|eukprot:CAMPEP_0194075654 /NCGR_PEP_ID=MMETSP0149-20130528/2612_1 /TAXON_ID=122233 /ORGANISM="Chaetoceros debilis, Strain MM31A-1" /LENGTH=349 /DNA_ID=CAMNT_0038756193 /DNA_START=15 /DNA_END=1064 /DNA_ORIENTATION=+